MSVSSSKIPGSDLDTTDSAGIRGGTDGTVIGNNGTRLLVDALVSGSGVPPAFSKKLRYRDMNASTGGVARGSTITTSWTTLYSRSGSGLFTGLTVNGSTMSSNWQFRFVIDGDEIFTSTGILVNDMNSLNIYNLGTTTTNTSTQGINVSLNSSSFFFTAPAYAPIAYSTSISVLARTSTSTKTFNAGLIVLTEET